MATVLDIVLQAMDDTPTRLCPHDCCDHDNPDRCWRLPPLREVFREGGMQIPHQTRLTTST